MQRLVPELQKVVGRYARTRKDILSDFPEPIPMLAPLAGTVGSIPDSGTSRNVSRLLTAFLIETRQLRNSAGFFLSE
jgi:hypothetical protein